MSLYLQPCTTLLHLQCLSVYSRVPRYYIYNISLFTAVYLAITLCFSVVSCILSVFVMSVSFQDTTKPLPQWGEKIATNSFFPLSCLKKCSNCVLSNRNRTSCDNVTTRSEKNVNDCGDISLNDDGYSPKKDAKSELTWTELAKKLDRLFFYVTFVLITLETIAFLLILMIGGSLNSQQLVSSLWCQLMCKHVCLYKFTYM